MTMNFHQVSYRSPTRMQLRDARFQRQDLGEKFSSCLEDIRQIRMASAKETLTVDPNTCVVSLKEKADNIFTPVPDKYKPHVHKHSDPHAAVGSKVKPLLIANEEWAKNVGGRNSRSPTSHEAIVSSKHKLMLTWDAERALLGKNPKDEIKDKAQSHYHPIFASDGSASEGSDVNALYKPPENNRRKVVEEKLSKIRSEFITIDKARKAKILETKPLPPPKKVDKDFKPACSAYDNASGVERRTAVASTIAERQKALIGGKPFK